MLKSCIKQIPIAAASARIPAPHDSGSACCSRASHPVIMHLIGFIPEISQRRLTYKDITFSISNITPILLLLQR